MKESPIKIILADDKASYRALVLDILEPFNVTVVGEAENGQECLSLLENNIIPDIILLDLEMPVMDGNVTFNLLCEKFPYVKVVILSYHYDHLLIENYLYRGAKGYLMKDGILDTPILLINALQKVHDGGTFVYEKPGEKKPFTFRQKQMLPLIFEGKTNEEIANDLGIKKRAVERQKQRIYQISGVYKTIDFYKYAFSRGLQYLGLKK